MSIPIKSFRDLDAWKEGHALALLVYKLVKSFPKEEMFALASQMRRSAVSATSNIAEGFSRQSYKEKAQFYSIAQGSVTELQSQFDIALDVSYINSDTYHNADNQSIKVHKIINGLIKKSKLFSVDAHNS
ncbi:MAG: four helix bundle protein [Candidatus Paceibacterota bacterium]|jgi:four helix bundle protein